MESMANGADEGTGGDVSADGRARRAGFERELLPHLDALYSFARRLTRDPNNAEDLVSEAVLYALDRWESYELGTNARAWLLTILYHAFVNRWRVARREVRLPEDHVGDVPFDVVGERDPEGRFYDSFLDDEITRAIESLPEEYRVAVVLSDVNGLRYAEIAAVLNVPEGTVKSRLFRGRRMLRTTLVRYATEMGYLSAERRGAA